MAQYCTECCVKILEVDPEHSDFRLPLFWPFPRRRRVQCEGCGEITVDWLGQPQRDNPHP